MRASPTDIGRAFDEKSRGLDRRQLLKAGAWAAPVLILATATPAAAASTTPVTPRADYSGKAVVVYSLNAYDESHPGRMKGSAKIGYDANAFGGWPVQPPATMTVTWRVLATNGTSTVVLTERTDTLPLWGSSAEITFVKDGLTPGNYTITLITVSSTFTPNPAPQPDGSSKVFALTPPTASVPLTIT